MKDLTGVMRALSDSNRLRILKLLEKKSMCVCELAAVVGITQPSVSRHLKKLKSAGLIGDRQAGFWTDYFLCRPGTNPQLCFLLKKVLAALDAEPVIRKDCARALRADRRRLCCQKKAKGGEHGREETG